MIREAEALRAELPALRVGDEAFVREWTDADLLAIDLLADDPARQAA
jgi:hypothetical protein